MLSRRVQAHGTMTDSADNLRRFVNLYRSMARIRAFEETALEAHKAGEIPGPLHVSIGQEAVAAGVCANLHATAGSPPIIAATATRSPRLR